MITAIAAALTLSVAPTADQSTRYALTLTVVNSGIQEVAARTVIVEDGHASVTTHDSTGAFEMSASLYPVQGDGDDQLVLEVSISDEGREPQAPRLILRRGGDAQIIVGLQNENGQVMDGFDLSLKPIASIE